MSIQCTTLTEVKMNVKELRLQAKTLEPIIRIGKNGLTERVVEEVKKLVRRRRLIKVKLLKSVLGNKKEVIEELVDKTNVQLIDAVGFVVVLARK